MRNRFFVQRGNNAAYLAAQAADKQKLADILDDPKLTDAARLRAVLPVEAAMKERFAAFQKTAAGHLAAELRDHAAAQPRVQLMGAVFGDPVRAAAMLALFRASSARDRLAYARLATAETDLVAVHAMHLAISEDQSIDSADVIAITDELSKATAATARDADAALLAFRIEASRLAIAGWQADEDAGLARADTLALANEAAALPREDGTAHPVGDVERRELLALVGAIPAGV